MNNKQRIDVCHIGNVYGKLTVISFSHRVKYKSKSTKKFWVCKCECGKEKFVATSELTSGRTKSCGCSRNKGGKIDNNGYRNIYVREQKKYVQEHRHVYETHYGIKLKPHQNIHHINGDRKDNRIENLELWDTSQPSGQRIEDKILYYHSLIDEYKNHPLYKELIYRLNSHLIVP
jgi:hypothetical protein